MQTERAMLGSQRAVGGSGFEVWSLGVGFRVEGQFLKDFPGTPKTGNLNNIAGIQSKFACQGLHTPTIFLLYSQGSQ